MDVADELLDTSMQDENDRKPKIDANLVNVFRASENIEPFVRKSIMKKPATPVLRSGMILGKSMKNN